MELQPADASVDTLVDLFVTALVFNFWARQKNSWADSGSGSLPSEW